MVWYFIRRRPLYVISHRVAAAVVHLGEVQAQRDAAMASRQHALQRADAAERRVEEVEVELRELLDRQRQVIDLING